MKPEREISDIDAKILKALLRDARTNLADIAKDCNLSITAIAQRYKKLKQDGIITGTSLVVSNSRSQHSLSVDIKAESDCEDSIIKAIKKLPRVRQCFKVIGKYDIHAAIRADSLEQIAQIKEIIEREKGVLQIEITTGIDRLYSFPENLLIKPIEDGRHG